MDFEQQLREIGKKIYKKIITFVEENKEDDDLYYDYAFIRLNNGQEIRYDFAEKTIEIPDSKECGYEDIIGTKIEITEDNTEITLELDNESIPKYKYISYDTGLNEKIENCQKDNIKLSYKRELLEQRKMTKELKGRMKHEYNQLNSALCNMTYDKDKTHNIDNFTYEVYEIYNSYMHQKEMNALEVSSDKTLPAIQKAVEWWANKISITDNPNIIYKLRYREVEPLAPLTEEQLTNFKEILAKKIMKEIYEYDGDLVEIGTNDYPMIVYGSMIEAQINKRRFPNHPLTMYIHAYRVSVEEYREHIEIYNSTTEEDVEEIKKLHREQLSKSRSYTLKKV